MSILKYNLTDKILKRKYLDQVIELRNDVHYLNDYILLKMKANRTFHKHKEYVALNGIYYCSIMDYPDEVSVYEKSGLGKLEELLLIHRKKIILKLENINVDVSKIKTKIRKRKLNDILK